MKTSFGLFLACLLATPGLSAETLFANATNQAEQTFSGGDTGVVQLQAFVAVRGTRVAARVRTLSRFGPVELHSILTSFVILRNTP